MLRKRQSFLRRRAALGCGVCVLLAGALRAADDPGPPPASFILDEARLFDSASAEKMTRALTDAQRDTGCLVYIAATSYLEGGNMRERSQALVARWLGERPGVVIAFNRGNAQPAISVSPGFWRRYPADEIALALADSGSILAKSAVPPEQRVQDTVTLLLKKLRILEQGRVARESGFRSEEIRLALALAAGLAAAGIALWLTAARWRRNLAALGPPSRFPEVTVGSRLGARFGGGAVGEAGAGRNA